MNPHTLLLFLLLATISNTATASGDPRAGQAFAVECIGCHGEAGISRNDIWPNIAGQKASYLRKSLHAFRNGARSNPIMASVARLLSDQDIDDIAAWYASLPVDPEAVQASQVP